LEDVDLLQPCLSLARFQLRMGCSPLAGRWRIAR
jgi:hypothetical protein